jgi:hypothetical protein
MDFAAPRGMETLFHDLRLAVRTLLKARACRPHRRHRRAALRGLALAGAGLAAGVAPALVLTATRVSPLVALRHE